MDGIIIKKRIRAVRRELDNLSRAGLRGKRIDCFIVTKPANVTYATGFLGDDSWAVITKNRVYLITDSRYTEQASKECAECKIIQRTDSLPKAVAKLVQRLKSVKTVTVEKSVSLADFDLLKKEYHGLLVRQAHHPERSRGAIRGIQSVANVIETIRSCKDSSEVAAIKAASRIAAKALKKTLGFIKPGVTENELAGLLNLEIRKLDAVNSFDTIIAFGPNASRPHHQPSRRKLKRRDTVLIDFGVKYKGYCCDITRCFAIGNPTKLYKKVYDVVEKAQAAAIKMIKPGVEISKVDAAARDVIRKTCPEHSRGSGLPVYGHGTGHGLGLEVHELPVINPKSKDKLKAGQVITIEPGVYIPGKLGIRIEDDILVTESLRLRPSASPIGVREAIGCKILTYNCLRTPLIHTKMD
jgi:Xaa-Pro aminopeptidase